jgi:glyoxylase-like metal-dependent hydrolase (beta-lactamase superfamily II)
MRREKMNTFKYLLTLLPLLISANAYTQDRDFSAVVIKTHQVADNIHYLEGSGGNIGVLSGDDGIFLVDDQFAQLTDKIVAAIKKIDNGEIKYLVNSHHHPDHTGGNENLGNQGALIFAHENVRKRIMPNVPAIALPVVTFTSDISLHINGETVDIFKVPNAHTDNDSFIYFRDSNVMHTGDVYRNTTYPYIDVNSGGSYAGLLTALQTAINVADADTKIIPGHGVIADQGDVADFLSMVKTIGDRVHALMEDGKNLEQIIEAGITAEYDDRWEGGRIGNIKGLITVIYNEAM